jgi:hypothetical protein
MKRILIAATTGCLILFVWGALSHMVLLIGSGFTPLPNEDKIINELEHSIPGKGLYLFPGNNFKNRNSTETFSWEKKFRTGPVGFIVYRPVGGDPLSQKKLFTQFISNFLSALIATIIASLVVAPYWNRVFAITLLGAISCTSVSMIFWNWYEFPAAFFVAQCIDQIVGSFLAGLVIARIIATPIHSKNP